MSNRIKNQGWYLHNFMNGPNKLECYIILGWKNTLAYWTLKVTKKMNYFSKHFFIL